MRSDRSPTPARGRLSDRRSRRNLPPQCGLNARMRTSWFFERRPKRVAKWLAGDLCATGRWPRRAAPAPPQASTLHERSCRSPQRPENAVRMRLVRGPAPGRAEHPSPPLACCTDKKRRRRVRVFGMGSRCPTFSDMNGSGFFIVIRVSTTCRLGDLLSISSSSCAIGFGGRASAKALVADDEVIARRTRSRSAGDVYRTIASTSPVVYAVSHSSTA